MTDLAAKIANARTKAQIEAGLRVGCGIVLILLFALAASLIVWGIISVWQQATT